MSHSIRFTKMHGIGNDFMIINACDQAIDLKQLRIKDLADRHIGIGFDQLLIIEPGKQGDFFCRIFNADGSQAEQCGNGLRCIARFIQEENMHKDPILCLETTVGIFPIEIKDYDHIRASMGVPTLQEKLIEIPIKPDLKLPISMISMGNPHAIIKVDNVNNIAVDQLGPQVAAHAYFPHGANVGFMQIIDKGRVRLRTYERGSGETQACGSNACAAAVAGIINGWLNHQVTIEFHNGTLMIEWEGEGNPIYMTGPAARVFTGEI